MDFLTIFRYLLDAIFIYIVILMIIKFVKQGFRKWIMRNLATTTLLLLNRFECRIKSMIFSELKMNSSRWSRRKQRVKMKEIFHTYLKKSDSFVGGTLTGFFCIFTIGIIPNFVENYNLMITLEVFIFSIWFGILFYRHQLLKNNE